MLVDYNTTNDMRTFERKFFWGRSTKKDLSAK